MLQGIRRMWNAVADFNARRRRLDQLLRSVFGVLDRHSIRAGSEYDRIHAANGPTNALGVEITGIRTYSLSLQIAETIVSTGLNAPLLFRRSEQQTFFCGDYCSDNSRFERRVESLENQLRYETGDVPSASPYQALVDINVRRALLEAGYLDTAYLVDSDMEGVSVTVTDLPDERTAHDVHRVLLSALPELPLSVRFLHKGCWHVFLDSHSPLR